MDQARRPGGHAIERDLLHRTADVAVAFLDGLPERRVSPRAGIEDLRSALGGALPEDGTDPAAVIDDLARAADGGLVASAGPRYFGFVIGGSIPAAVAADWLTAAWDQNAGLYATSPAASVVEEVVAAWLLELFGLPPDAGVGFTTGAQMASFTCLAAARHSVLARVGWDVEEDGLSGAPRINVVTGAEAHVTILAALRMLGVGSRAVIRVPTDEQGRMRADLLRDSLRGCEGPTIVCAQAGNVNTGSFDPLAEVASAAREHGAWLHVDGAFGLWAATSPTLRSHLDGLEQADSWTTDAHKWLNVPYDSGIAIVRDANAQQAAMTLGAAYYVETVGRERDPYGWVPEASRRARGFAIYAALRSLGRAGVAELVERCCSLACRMAERLARAPGVRVLNEVVLNQVLVRFSPRDGDVSATDALTREVIARVQADGICWLGGTTWHDMPAMRISVSNWSTTEADIDGSADAIVRAARAAADEAAAAPA
ncbi:MAG: aminotransferase class V-fold PLP-dependent enzyme [Chloroflexota bacterium]|nr:aminotransferase class V-fold PLP-dependent enzyme [Chloroflexota bacterium]